MRITLEDAVRNARTIGYARRYPQPGDPRIRNGFVFPQMTPQFSFPAGATIFTLGSCFARTVEENLAGFVVPTKTIAVPAGERPGRSNGILNEYNPGTMCQRVEYAASGASFGDQCIAPEGDGFLDLLLPEYVTPGTPQRLMQRRAEVDDVYRSLRSSEAIIVTLDLVEAWFDRETELYLNRLPPPGVLLTDRGRFELRILDVDETQALLDRMVRTLVAMGVHKIILSVSPVSLEQTFSGRDCVVANSFSKSVLIACSNAISHCYREVQYFPGYEIAIAAGANSYEADHVHVRDDLVESITKYLVDTYADM